MRTWHRTWQGDLGLRLAVCAVAAACFGQLFVAPPDAHEPGVVAVLDALIGFLAACAGSAMAMLGKHLFDRAEVGERWRRQPAGDRRRDERHC